MEKNKNSGKRKRTSGKQKEVEDEKIEAETTKISLYDLLNISKEANVADIKKAYRSLALKLHPDKNKDDPEATRNFQKVNEAYQILIDPEKRKLYDETGYTGNDSEGFSEAYEFFKNHYKRVSKEDIDAFAKEYRHSKEEEDDILRFYSEQKGDVTLILEHIMLSENEDIERFVNMIEEKIKNNELKKYSMWDKTKKKIKLLPDESAEVEAQKKEDFANLQQAILAKYEKGNNDLIASLEAKYGGGKGKGKKKKSVEEEYEIDEEEFQRIQEEMLAKNKNKKVKK